MAQLASVSVPFAKISPVAPANNGFTLVKILVCAHGKNRNMSHISKEELDAAVPTLAYVPVVGHLMEKIDKDGNSCGYYFGGHDYELTEDWELRPLTVPFGVVTADEPCYETVVEYGKPVEYMVAHAYLWTERYPELLEAVYSDDVWFNESMEVNYENYSILEEDSNYVDLHGLTFSALCILGKSDDPEYHTEPCFISSRIEPVKFDLDTNQFNQLMAEMRTQLSFCFEENVSKEGGNESLNQEMITAIFEEMGISMDAINFEITDDMTEEQLRAALEAFAEENAPEGDPVEGEGDEGSDADPADPVDDDDDEGGEGEEEFALFSATANQKRDALRNALDPIVERDASGRCVSEISFWVADFDDAYVYVERYHWTLDNYETKYGRFAYSFDDATKTATITGNFEEMVRMWLTLEEAAALEAEREELATLRVFKQEAEKAAYNVQVENIRSEFEDVASLEEFESIIENASDLEEMELRLMALRGKQVKVKKTPKQESTVKFGLDNTNTDDSDDAYGGIFTKYNIRKK